MFVKTQIMLYVNDVASSASFWVEHFGAKITAEQEMVDGSLYLAVTVNEGSELCFYSREFIEKYSPEVLEMMPSLLFTVDNLQELHERLVVEGVKVGEIVDNAGKKAFNFADNEERYFAFSER